MPSQPCKLKNTTYRKSIWSWKKRLDLGASITDRGEKFEFYRTLTSFQEYVLVDQYKIHLEHYAKTPDNKWLLSEYEDINATLTLISIPFQIQLTTIYRRVIF
ncbi:MAG: Uma2 family endonuclease [Leptolyngbyaceae cyanobacterium RU_5_1]|nr:Uma2 family endonuclease [Leptolyngbyaceae cyanobacterium RU_5_1]